MTFLHRSLLAVAAIVAVAAAALAFQTTTTHAKTGVAQAGIDSSSKKVIKRWRVLPKKGYYQVRTQLQLRNPDTGALKNAYFDVNGHNTKSLVVMSRRNGTCQPSRFRDYTCYTLRTPTMKVGKHHSKVMLNFLYCPSDAGCLSDKLEIIFS